MFTFVVEEGQRVLVRRPNGTMEIVAGPRRVWRGWNLFRAMQHHVAHPGDYLIVRFRDGRQEHLTGPAEVWFDPRVHLTVSREDALQVAAREAVVVYSRAADQGPVSRNQGFLTSDQPPYQKAGTKKRDQGARPRNRTKG